MAYPNGYERDYGFQNYQDTHPQNPLPGDQLDAQLDAVGEKTADIAAFLRKALRSDGSIANGSVGVDQLAADLTIGFKEPSTWAPGTIYDEGDTAFYADAFYQCVTAHTSGATFSSGNWTLLVDFGAQATAAAASAVAAAASATAAAALVGVVQWCVAGGTADAITGTFPTTVASLTDGLVLAFRAASANATTTPTFKADGTTARTLVKRGGQALSVSDVRSGGEYFVRYNLANTRWELLNPSKPADYVEGAWTPIDASGGSFSLTDNGSTFTKNGREVTVHCNVTFPNTPGSALASVIGGLPYPVASGCLATGLVITNAATTNALGARSISAASTVEILNANTNVSVANSGLSTANVRFSLRYNTTP